jgi:hypothetical protein
MSESALPIEFNTDISPELTVEVGKCFYMDIWLDNVPEQLLTAGFFITHDASLATIVDIAVYDEHLGDPWDAGFTTLVPDADGSGTYMVACGNFASVPPEDARIANIEICTIAEGINIITITTIPDFQTVVSGVPPDYEVFDSQIMPHVITVDHIAPPCRCEITGPSMIFSSFEPVTTQYNVSSNSIHCDNPPGYVWSDTCIFGDVDQNGLMTVPTFYFYESCEVCVTDTSNIDINTGEMVDCCLPIDLAGT